MHLFHCPNLRYDHIELPEEESHHALHVLRLSAGDKLGVLDGAGGYAEALITATTKRACTVEVLRREQAAPERNARIHLAVAPTKQMERFEWLLEKATEVGVDRITPLITKRTERTKLRMDRLERVLLGAMKQSQRRWLPQLDPFTALDALVPDPQAQRFFGWCAGQLQAFAKAYRPTVNAVVLIGPEGDFTLEEATRLDTRGYQAISLGTARLRTETAALAACTWMNFAQQS